MTAIAQSEQHAKRADCTNGSRDKRPPEPFGWKGPCGTTQPEHKERPKNGDEEVGQAYKEKGFIARVRIAGRSHALGSCVKEYTVNSPRNHREENEYKPRHLGLGIIWIGHGVLDAARRPGTQGDS